jgi:hypothetical protein
MTLPLKEQVNVQILGQSGAHEILGKECGSKLDFRLAHILGLAVD